MCDECERKIDELTAALIQNANWYLERHDLAIDIAVAALVRATGQALLTLAEINAAMAHQQREIAMTALSPYCLKLGPPSLAPLGATLH